MHSIYYSANSKTGNQGRVYKRYSSSRRSKVSMTKPYSTTHNNPIILRSDRRAQIPNLSNSNNNNFPFPPMNNGIDDDRDDGSAANSNGVRFGDFTVLNHNTHPGVIYYFIELRNPLGSRYNENNENNNGENSRNVRGGVVFRSRQGGVQKSNKNTR